MAEEILKNKKEEESEIDLLELASKLWDQRRKLLKWSICGAVIGLIVAFSIPKEYCTNVTLAPEANDQKSGASRFGTLASMAGINLGSSGGSDAVYPDLYPNVVSSTPFITGLFDVEVKLSEDDREISFEDYLENETRSPWWEAILSIPGKIISFFRSLGDDDNESGETHHLDLFRLTKSEAAMAKAIRGCINVAIDKKTSVVTIGVTVQDPLVSAMMADTVVTRLQEYITAYRTNKAREDLIYAETLNEEARKDYFEAQQRYADFLDRNQKLAFQSSQVTRERLYNEATLAFNVFNQTSLQLQAARAKVQETTPVYAVIEPATVPVKPCAPHKAKILVIYTMLAFILCAAWILFLQPILTSVKEKFHSEPQQPEKITGPDPE